MRIDSSGNVGIGTTSPAQKLHVATTAAPSGTTQSFLRLTGDATYGADFGGGLIQGTGPIATISTVNAGTATERMRIDSSGNVGIGTTSPSSKLSVGGNPPSSGTIAGVASSGGTSLALSDNTNSSLYVRHPSGAPATIGTDAGGGLAFATGTTERMRLGSNGGFAIGGTGTDASLHIQASYGGYDRLTQISPSGTSKNAFNIMAAKNSGGGDNWWTWGVRTDAVWCLIPGVDSAMTSSTGIYFDSTAQAYKPGGGSWQATSDVRVKTNITPITDAASRIMALKPSAFDYRAPEAHAGRVSDRGFIAQEFEEVYPHSVSAIAPICDEEKDFFADGEAMKTLGLNNDFFADLVALVQEQQTTINDLRARMAQLEGN